MSFRKIKTLIAEVKTQSPFGFKSEYDWFHLFDMANEIGDVISIHTDPKWGGAFSRVALARKLTNKPILAKGIHPHDKDIWRALDNGADYVLVVGRIPNMSLGKLLLEPTSIKGLLQIPDPNFIVWNARNPFTNVANEYDINFIRTFYYGWLCQASCLTQLKDFNPAVDAYLVGEHLPQIYEEIKRDPETWNNQENSC